LKVFYTVELKRNFKEPNMIQEKPTLVNNKLGDTNKTCKD